MKSIKSISNNNYNALGYAQIGREFSSEKYRYGMNGQESLPEVSGSKSHYIAEYWMYDSRIGRRWNIDPVFKDWESPYACFSNNPIVFSDENGDDAENSQNQFCPLCGLFDYAVQVGFNLYEGKGWSSFTDVDLIEILSSTVPGLKLLKETYDVVDAYVDLDDEGNWTLKTTPEAAKEYLTNKITKKITKKATKTLKKLSSDKILRQTKRNLSKTMGKIESLENRAKKKSLTSKQKAKLEEAKTRQAKLTNEKAAYQFMNDTYGKMDKFERAVFNKGLEEKIKGEVKPIVDSAVDNATSNRRRERVKVQL